MKTSLVQKSLSALIPAKLPVLLVGAPGVGKTDMIKQAAETCGYDLLISHPVVSDPTDAKGLPFPVKNGKKTIAEFLPFGDLRQALNANRPLLWFLDDIGQASPIVQASYMQLLYGGRVNGHQLPGCVTMAGATNRRQDRAGVTGILEAVKSRFATILDVEADLDDWVLWALRSGIRTEIIAFLRFRPALLHDFTPTGDMKQSPCPRTWAFTSKLMDAEIPVEAQYSIMAGAVGEGAAAELIGFLKVWRNMPNPDKILMDPENSKVPEDPATLYALCGALAKRAGEQNFGRLVTYANRMPAEFSVLLVRDAVRALPILAETRSFIEWATANADVLI